MYAVCHNCSGNFDGPIIFGGVSFCKDCLKNKREDTLCEVCKTNIATYICHDDYLMICDLCGCGKCEPCSIIVPQDKLIDIKPPNNTTLPAMFSKQKFSYLPNYQGIYQN
jgi:hypothetical protein